MPCARRSVVDDGGGTWARLERLAGLGGGAPRDLAG